MISLSGHIGAKVSALVDGQLPPAEEERAWSHVLGCPGCRRLVESEGWTKRQLLTLADPGAPSMLRPEALLDAMQAWSAVDALERRSLRRRAVVVVGGGAVGAAVLGMVAVAGPLAAPGKTPVRPSPATIRMEPAVAPAGSATGAESTVSAATSAGWTRRSR